MTVISPAHGTGPRDGRRPRGLGRLLPASQVLRSLTSVTLVNTFGNGLFFTTSALFFIRSMGITPAQLGLALAIAGGCGIVAGPPLGWLADRWGARRVLVAALAAEGAGTLGYVAVHSFVALLPLLCAVTFVDRGGSGVRNALIATALPPADRTYGRAYLRAVTNVGIGAGAAVAAAALQSNTQGAYMVAVIADAITFLAAAALLAPLKLAAAPGAPVSERGGPAVSRERWRRAAGRRGTPGHDGPRRRAGPAPRSALTDLPYLLISALNGLMSLQFGMLQVGVPLWVVRSTHAPRLTVSVVLVLNTAMIVLLQVRASRGVEDLHHAAVVCRRAGLLLAAACAGFGYAHGLPAAAAVAVLVAAAVAQTVAEMLSAAAGWSLSYGLADQAAHGAYQGVFNSGFSAGMLLAPLVVTSTAIRFGVAGWIALGAVFALAGAAFIPATRWAVARRAAGRSGVDGRKGGKTGDGGQGERSLVNNEAGWAGRGVP
jgi:MFS family permease